jgi:hypothetical protein
MLLTILASTRNFTSLAYVDSFVVSSLFSYQMADWWTVTFGAPDESVIRARPLVLNVRADNVDYTQVSTYAACLALERSWYISDTAFSIHLDHDIVHEGVVIQYGNGQGFSDTDVVYIDDVEYLPLITQAPSINRAEDIQGYSKLRLISGSLGLSNRGGRLDYLKDFSVIGNEARLSYLDNTNVIDNQAQTSAVVPQAAYFVEEAEYGNAETGMALQDTRKLDKLVPARFFDSTTYPYLNDSIDGKVVPLVFGVCRSVKCIPVNTELTGTLSATYRCSELLTSISEVRVKIDDTWTVVATSSTDLPNGTFTIATARASTGQAPYECQADVVGIPVVNAPDIIEYLYLNYENQAFNGTFYDTTTWTANKAGIPTCGLVIDKQRAILDVIPDIQNGVFPTFRFDTVVGDTRKTIRLDDKTRPVDWYVSSLDVLNIDDLNPKDVSDYLFGEVTVEYDQDHSNDEYRKITVDTYKQDVIENYQWSNSKSLPTLLTNSTDAQTMADAKALEFSVPIRTIDLILMGQRYFGVEIFDIMQVDTAMGREEYYTGDWTGREFLGVIKVQVIGIQPDYGSLTTAFTCKILSTVALVVQPDFLVTEDGDYILTEDGYLIEVE